MDWIRHKVEVRWTCCTQVEEYMTAAGRHSAASSHLRELSWRKYVHHVRAFSEQYRKRVDDHVTRTMRRWTAKVCLLYTSPSPRDRQKSRMPSSA